MADDPLGFLVKSERDFGDHRRRVVWSGRRGMPIAVLLTFRYSEWGDPFFCHRTLRGFSLHLMRCDSFALNVYANRLLRHFELGARRGPGA